MKDKVYIKFDLGNEEMIRQAINMPELYEDFLVWLLHFLPRTDFNTFEDEYMKIKVML